MKRLILAILLSAAAIASAQKVQDSDTLIWNGRIYALVVEPYTPSVLMVYYQRSAKVSPFTHWSSNNNRGHVAKYEIINDAVYLRSIEAKRYRTRLGNLWTESGIDTVVTPDFFDVTPLDSSALFSADMVLCDWFTGIVKLNFLPSSKKESKSDEVKGSRYLQLKNGKIIANVFVSNEDKAKIDKTLDDSSLSSKRSSMNPLREIIDLYGRQVDFYSRCAMDREQISFNGHDGLFERQPNSLTLAMLRHDNNPIRFFANCSEGQPVGGAPFGRWLLSGDSLFLVSVETHHGKDVFSFTTAPVDMQRFLADSVVDGIAYGSPVSYPDGNVFASWVSGDYVVHYGTWEKGTLDVPVYTISKTQTLRIVNGIVTSSQFSPSSFDDDLEAAAASSFSPCNPEAVYSVDDKQLAEAVGDFKHPKNNPTYKGDKPTFRSWFLNNPLTDERAKNRLFRVRLAFMVNCNGEVGQWRVISKGKGELYEFANIVLDLVKTMPHNWNPATDRKGNPVDCWQIMEFTVSDGVLTNGNYK